MIMTPWTPETRKIVRSNWLTRTPDEIAKLVNNWLTEDARLQNLRSWAQTSAGGVIYQAAKLRLITRQNAQDLLKELKSLRARQHYINPKVRNEVLQRDRFKCLLCGATEQLEVDHVVPVVDGGKSDADNLQTLCHACHRKVKGLSNIDFRKPFLTYHCEHCHRTHYRNLTVDEIDARKKMEGLRSA